MNRYNITIVAIIPTYLIHVSTRLRLSIGLSTEFESPTVFKTSKALRCALYEFQKDNVNDIVSGKPQIVSAPKVIENITLKICFVRPI